VNDLFCFQINALCSDIPGCNDDEHEGDVASQMLRRAVSKKLTDVSEMVTALMIVAVSTCESLSVSSRLLGSASQKRLSHLLNTFSRDFSNLSASFPVRCIVSDVFILIPCLSSYFCKFCAPCARNECT
jgi:hypothetical protein